jgi:hypothetical protein
MSERRRREVTPGGVDIPTLRRKLVWIVPLFLGAIWLCWDMFDTAVISTYSDIRSRAPIIEITGFALTAPLAIVFFLSTLLTFLLWAMYLDRIGDWILKNIAIHVAYALGVSMVATALLSWPVQEYFMPKLGYSRCGILYGHTSLMSAARWLKYPELCVRDKSIAWVKEQAREIETQGTEQKPQVSP